MLLFVLIFSSFKILAQSVPYTFHYTQENFEYLTDPISVNEDKVWDTQNFSQLFELGFDFTVGDQTFDKIEIRSGGIDFHQEGATRKKRLFSLYKLLIDKGATESLSPISYQIFKGENNNEAIFKVEWRNAGIVGNGPSTPPIAEDFVDIQVWLHQNSNQISIHFGPSHISQGSPLYSLNSTNFLGIKLLVNDNFIGPIGNGNMPTYIIGNCTPTTCNRNIGGYPSEGIVYWFNYTGISTSIAEEEKEIGLSVFPNPMGDQANVKIMDEDFTDFNGLYLYNSYGQLIWKQLDSVKGEMTTINLEGRAPGLYYLIADHSKGLITKKIMKK